MTTQHSTNASAATNRTRRRLARTTEHLLIALTLLASILNQTVQPQTVYADGIESLAAKQQSVTKRYEQLEELLLRLAEVESTENPERSALLRRAANRPVDRLYSDQVPSSAWAKP